MSKFHKKKIKGLRREIEELDRGMRDAASLEEHQEINAAELYERWFLEEDLDVFETLELKEQAELFGISISPQDSDSLALAKFWDKTRDDRSFLTEKGRAVVKNRIIDARFSYWKRWIDIVTPIASTIISISALLLAAPALYLQVSSDPIIVVPPPSQVGFVKCIIPLVFLSGLSCELFQVLVYEIPDEVRPDDAGNLSRSLHFGGRGDGRRAQADGIFAEHQRAA